MHRIAIRRSRRGYSLLEILVVLSIIALISGVVAISLMKYLEKARVDTTTQSARVIRDAVKAQRIHDSSVACATIDDLVRAGVFDAANKRTDAWDQSFAIKCLDNEVIVSSAGPDKKSGTDDDISIPTAAQLAR